VRLAGQQLSAICRLDIYGAWRLLTVFESPERCILLLVAEHTRTANPYQLIYDALGLDAPCSRSCAPAPAPSAAGRRAAAVPQVQGGASSQVSVICSL
jgi:hypothetical protein